VRRIATNEDDTGVIFWRDTENNDTRETSMSDGSIDLSADARAKAWSIPLEDYHVADPALFKADAMWPYFERLRKEDPVHFSKGDEDTGPYWSVTRYNDIMAVDTNHAVFSSDAHLGGITIRNFDEDFVLPMFIAMDPPKHDIQRKTVSPIVSPVNLAKLEGIIRERVCTILDDLPIGEPFDWVDKVSIELTTQMLATLFDFPWEERRKLTRWSDVATASPESGIVESEDARRAELLECLGYFTNLWNERVNAEEPGGDLISMLAQGEATKNMPPMEYLGNIILLIVGGNDTTRNSLTGGLYALSKNPEQEAKLRAHPELIPSMVSEIIRWQTPAGPHAPHGAGRRRAGRQDHQEGRQGRHVVRLGQPRRHGDRKPRRLHHRPREPPTPPVVRLRHPPLRGQPPGRDAAEDRLGGNPQALPEDRGSGRAASRAVDLREGVRDVDGADPGAGLVSFSRMGRRKRIRPPRTRPAS
jgi:cytochrome P450